MRLPTGTADQYIYFVAVASSDRLTRQPGLTGFTVARSRNGATAVAYTTPTVVEVSASLMPGVYALLLDEDMTMDAGDYSQELCLHITRSGMEPVTRTIELYSRNVNLQSINNATLKGDGTTGNKFGIV